MVRGDTNHGEGIDNVGIKIDENGQAKFDLIESKYSIQEITVNNVKQTLTTGQADAYNIILNGTQVKVFVGLGKNSPARLNQPFMLMQSENYRKLKPGDEITGQITSIALAAPAGKSSNAPAAAPVTPAKKAP